MEIRPCLPPLMTNLQKYPGWWCSNKANWSAPVLVPEPATDKQARFASSSSMFFYQLQQHWSSAPFPNFIGTNYISEISNGVHYLCIFIIKFVFLLPKANGCGVFVHHWTPCGNITLYIGLHWGTFLGTVPAWDKAANSSSSLKNGSYGSSNCFHVHVLSLISPS